MDRLIFERDNRYKIGRNNLKHVVVDTEDEPRFGRCVDQSNKVPLSFLKDFAKYWLAILYRNTRIRRSAACVISFSPISRIDSQVNFLCIPVPLSNTDCIGGGFPISSPSKS